MCAQQIYGMSLYKYSCCLDYPPYNFKLKFKNGEFLFFPTDFRISLNTCYGLSGKIVIETLEIVTEGQMRRKRSDVLLISRASLPLCPHPHIKLLLADREKIKASPLCASVGEVLIGNICCRS